MSNIKQQKKRILTDKKRYLMNRSFVSQSRTAIKNANLAIENEKIDIIKLKVQNAVKLLDKLLSKKIKKANFVARNKSKLLQKFEVKKKVLESKIEEKKIK